MRIDTIIIAFCLGACAATAAAQPGRAGADSAAHAELKRDVMNVERAFAKTMADRDHAAFTSFVSEEAVFFSGPAPLRGKPRVAEWWKRFFDKPDAPFSWEPDEVEVLDSGTLALSSGPVRNASGKLVARFTSVWRLEAPGVWRIIFDRGNDVCEPEKK